MTRVTAGGVRAAPASRTARAGVVRKRRCGYRDPAVRPGSLDPGRRTREAGRVCQESSAREPWRPPCSEPTAYSRSPRTGRHPEPGRRSESHPRAVDTAEYDARGNAFHAGPVHAAKFDAQDGAAHAGAFHTAEFDAQGRAPDESAFHAAEFDAQGRTSQPSAVDAEGLYTEVFVAANASTVHAQEFFAAIFFAAIFLAAEELLSSSKFKPVKLLAAVFPALFLTLLVFAALGRRRADAAVRPLRTT